MIVPELLFRLTMNDAYPIRLAKTELREGYNTGNLDRILAVFSDGLGYLSTACASFWGPEAKAVLRHRLKRMFALNRAKLAVTIISIRIAGDWAFDWGWHSLTLTPRKGGRAKKVRMEMILLDARNQKHGAGSRPSLRASIGC